MCIYDGKYIAKHEKINGVTIETYVECIDGKIYLRTYVNFEFYSETCIANLNYIADLNNKGVIL